MNVKQLMFTTLALVALLVAPVWVSAADGEKIYSQNCKGCHSSEFVKAPQLGKKEDWKERIPKGKETLVQSVIKGVQGYTGMMPPRGGNPKLTDKEITAAVDYMINAIK